MTSIVYCKSCKTRVITGRSGKCQWCGVRPRTPKKHLVTRVDAGVLVERHSVYFAGLATMLAWYESDRAHHG